MLFKKAATIASTVAVLGLVLAGCGAQSDPAPAPVQERASTSAPADVPVRLGTPEEAAPLLNSLPGELATSGVSGVLIKGECAMVIDLVLSSESFYTRHTKDGTNPGLPKRAAAIFEGRTSPSEACPTNVFGYMSGLKIVDDQGQNISEYVSVFNSPKTLVDTSSLTTEVYLKGLVGAQADHFAAALEIPVDKLQSSMHLVLETPAGDLKVEGQDWNKFEKNAAPSARFPRGIWLSVPSTK